MNSDNILIKLHIVMIIWYFNLRDYCISLCYTEAELVSVFVNKN